MKPSSFSRFLAVVFLSIPVAWWMSVRAQHAITAIATDPLAYAQHQRSLMHPTFLAQLVRAAILFGLMVGSTELVAFVFRRSILRDAKEERAAE